MRPKCLLLTFQGKITWKSTNETGGRRRSHSEAISAGISGVPKQETVPQERRIVHTQVLSVPVTPTRRVTSAPGSRSLNIKHQEVSFAITQFGSSAEPRYSQAASLKVLFLSVCPPSMYYNASSTTILLSAS